MKPHTVNLYAEGQKLPAPIVQVVSTRNARVLANSTNSSSDQLTATTNNRSLSTTSNDHDENDVTA